MNNCMGLLSSTTFSLSLNTNTHSELKKYALQFDRKQERNVLSMESLAEKTSQTKLAGLNFKVKSLKHNLIKYELISGHCVFLQRARRRVF